MPTSSSYPAIARTVRWTRWFAAVLLIVTVGMQIAAYLGASPHIVLHHPGGSWLSAVIAVLHTGFMIAGFVQLFVMLRHLERGELFSVAVTRSLRRFALFVVLAVVSATVLGPVLNMIFRDCADAAPCLRRIPIDLRGLWTLLISLIFFLVAYILDEARRIDDDNKQII